MAGLTVQIDWSQDDQAYAAVLIRDGQPWYLNGALAGMGPGPAAAVADLLGIARHLVIHGSNYLMGTPLPVADRRWLFALTDAGTSDDEAYAAIRAAENERN